MAAETGKLKKSRDEEHDERLRFSFRKDTRELFCGNYSLQELRKITIMMRMRTAYEKKALKMEIINSEVVQVFLYQTLYRQDQGVLRHS